MIKSKLVERISLQTPHRYRQDAEKIVNIIFAEITAAMARGAVSRRRESAMLYER